MIFKKKMFHVSLKVLKYLPIYFFENFFSKIFQQILLISAMYVQKIINIFFVFKT